MTSPPTPVSWPWAASSGSTWTGLGTQPNAIEAERRREVERVVREERAWHADADVFGAAGVESAAAPMVVAATTTTTTTSSAAELASTGRAMLRRAFASSPSPSPSPVPSR